MKSPLCRRILFLITFVHVAMAGTAFADQISCVADGKGNDTCDITYPNVIAAQTNYPNMVFQAGDSVGITAGGCVQTGGSGATWKRYVDPSGSDSDHLYHGLISIPGSTPGLVRLSSVVNATLPASTGGSLTLGYEDNQYGDNGYWSHDNGTGNQCSDESGENNGRAWIRLVIHHTKQPFLAAGTAYGMCHSTDATHATCHIDRPDVTHATETYNGIVFSFGDSVEISAAGCVQTGGEGATWKRYVDPSGDNSDHLYHGLISIPGGTAGMVRLQTVVGHTLSMTSGGTLTLGYEDDGYSDNGYWSHDDGTGDQCKNIGPASVDIKITHGAMSSGPHVVLEGLEVTQAIEDTNGTVPLVAGKVTWVRAYFSTTVSPSQTITATLTSQEGGNGAITVSSQAPVTLVPGTSLRARRESWTGSLNFQLPSQTTAPGNATLQITAIKDSAGNSVTCDECGVSKTATFLNTPPLRVHIVSMSYTTGSPASTFTPTSTDTSLLESWLGRAYPVGTVDASLVTVTSNSTWPFDCNHANAQLSAMRGNDLSNGTDSRTHYIALVSNGGGFMRGCASGVPSSPDPGTVASAPTGPTSGPNVPIDVTGDTDGSFGDWYGGHELAHTFGRAHPGFCNGNSKDDNSFPYPNGQISDDNGTDIGLDSGGVSPSVPLIVIPGASHFDIMTYCNQPLWLSAYTYEAVRSRLLAENGETGDGGAGGAPSHALLPPGKKAPYIHVVATVDLTARTAHILYLTPVELVEAPPQTAGTQSGEIRVLSADSELLQSIQVALRPDTDVPLGEHQTALVDAYVSYSDRISRVQIVLDGASKDEFKASTAPLTAPTGVKLQSMAPTANLRSTGTAAHIRLQWTLQQAPAQGVTYIVEISSDGKNWVTIGIGLPGPVFDLPLNQPANPYIRVSATNGLVKSAPTVVRGSMTPTPVVR
jgi:hypothetical protein